MALLWVGLCLPGDSRVGDCLNGDVSRTSFPMMVFCTAIFSENFFSGSLRSNFSNSAGVYWSRNSSIER